MPPRTLWLHLVPLFVVRWAPYTTDHYRGTHYVLHSFECIPWRDINHVITYHAYLGFERPNNPLRFVRHFFGHDANGKATRSTFCQDTTFEVYKDVGDFINDYDLTPSKITFYQGVYGEEISKGEMVSSDEEQDSSGDESDPSEEQVVCGSWVVTALSVGFLFLF